MADIDLAQRFPDFKPVAEAPSLATLNGCGLRVYGRSDQDAETGTYLKHYCLCLLYLLLFIPGVSRH
ncbi:MAG: hypothetical protein WD042_09590 [Phycisphaeraceae bacterium]